MCLIFDFIHGITLENCKMCGQGYRNLEKWVWWARIGDKGFFLSLAHWTLIVCRPPALKEDLINDTLQ